MHANRATLLEITNGNQVEALAQAAIQDAHVPVYPSRLVVKNNEIVGFMSVCAMPILTGWMHTEKTNARDSLAIRGEAEAIIKSHGYNSYVTLCNLQSPFHKHFPNHDYLKLMSADLFVKKL